MSATRVESFATHEWTRICAKPQPAEGAGRKLDHLPEGPPLGSLRHLWLKNAPQYAVRPHKAAQHCNSFLFATQLTGERRKKRPAALRKNTLEVFKSEDAQLKGRIQIGRFCINRGNKPARDILNRCGSLLMFVGGFVAGAIALVSCMMFTGGGGHSGINPYHR